MPSPPLRGVIFDLDGTLVDSALDFEAMRCEMGLAPGTPILEAIAQLGPDEAARCHAVLAAHEQAGAARASLWLGAQELVAQLDAWGLKRAVITRNARQFALVTLARVGLVFDLVVAREDAPIKPDPAAVHLVCRTWGLAPAEVLVIGDYRFDIEAGLRAGALTALFTRGRPPQGLAGAAEAHFTFRTFAEAEALLGSWLDV